MKAKKIVTIVFTVLTCLMIASSGLFKFLGGEEVKAGLGALGVGAYIPYLGAMEIVFVVLFAFPKTMKIGFLLLACYFAGALATEISHNGAVMNAMIPASLVWITAFLRDPSIFIDLSRENNLQA